MIALDGEVHDRLFVLVFQEAVQNDRPTAWISGLSWDTFYVHRASCSRLGTHFEYVERRR